MQPTFEFSVRVQAVKNPDIKSEHNKMPIECHPSKSVSETQSQATLKQRDFGVADSPFNGVKIELGFAILLGAILWLAADSITANEVTQWLILLVYGLLGMVWLVLRTRAVLRRCMISGEMSHETHK